MRVRFLPTLLAALLGAACALAPAFVSTPSVLEASYAVDPSDSGSASILKAAACGFSGRFREIDIAE